MPLYTTVVTLHVLAAMLWLGGMFFLAAVGAPVLRKVEPASLRAALFRDLGQQFRTVGWGAILTLVATGTTMLHLRGVLDADVLTASTFWASPFGRTLFWKLVMVGAMLVVQAFHDFVLGPAASRVEPGTRRALRLRRHAAVLARANAALGILLVIIAARLARGG